jgi:hypothetical protein
MRFESLCIIMDTGTEKQIRLMFERDGLSVTEIGQMLNLAPETVTLCLAKKEKLLKSGDGELRNKLSNLVDDALAVMQEVMEDSETPASVRMSAAQYILDTKLGQKPDKTNSIPEGINLTTIQNYFIAKNNMYEAGARKIKGGDEEMHKPIEVEATVTG